MRFAVYRSSGKPLGTGQDDPDHPDWKEVELSTLEELIALAYEMDDGLIVWPADDEEDSHELEIYDTQREQNKD